MLKVPESTIDGTDFRDAMHGSHSFTVPGAHHYSPHPSRTSQPAKERVGVEYGGPRQLNHFEPRARSPIGMDRESGTYSSWCVRVFHPFSGRILFTDKTSGLVTLEQGWIGGPQQNESGGAVAVRCIHFRTSPIAAASGPEAAGANCGDCKKKGRLAETEPEKQVWHVSIRKQH